MNLNLLVFAMSAAISLIAVNLGYGYIVEGYGLHPALCVAIIAAAVALYITFVVEQARFEVEMEERSQDDWL